MDLSLDLTEEAVSMLEKYADKHNISIAEFVKNIVLDRIKDEVDMEVYENAIKSYHSNPVKYTHSKVIRELGLVK